MITFGAVCSDFLVIAPTIWGNRSIPPEIMGKRASSGADGAAAFRKRAKITHDVPTGEEIGSSDQLRQLLTFDQDLRRARHGKYPLELPGLSLDTNH